MEQVYSASSFGTLGAMGGVEISYRYECNSLSGLMLVLITIHLSH